MVIIFDHLKLLCFLLLKSYVLLKLRSGGNLNNSTSTTTKTQVLNPISFWLTSWPALRRLLDLIELSTLFMASTGSSEEYQTLTLFSLSLCVCSLAMLGCLEVVMINAYEWGDLLDDLLKKLNQDHYHIPHQDNGGMDYVISLDDFQNHVIKLKGMFDVPSIEVPAATMMNQLFLEMRDIMRLQAETPELRVGLTTIALSWRWDGRFNAATRISSLMIDI
ncbi:hypothetical protein [Parasitella parasitica]|uniref:Uncharacterized protein n=1 Tax=Parasitella parasitica TaxID=35722 RepID=A0A0B7NIE5_9FUNG|nr:hypothetical protein [Parasitella parasitica]